MSKYKVGDRFIVEIGESYETSVVFGVEDDSPVKLFKIKGFNSLVLDDNGLDKLQKYTETQIPYSEAYNQGLADAWKLARKIFGSVDKGGYSDEQLEEAFGCSYLTMTQILYDFTPQEALAKIEAYEQEIKVGDIVTTINGMCEYVVTHVQKPNTLHVINSRNGYVQQMRIDVAKKTGRHIDIQQILDGIGKE